MGDLRNVMGDYVKHALKPARRAAVVVLFSTLAASGPWPAAHAQALDAQSLNAQSLNDGIAPAIITDMTGGAGPARDRRAGAYDADAPVRPHWCNKTGALVDDIHRLGGYSVMRADIGEGRTLERYWNTSEEVVIEHGADGTSCLVDLRRRGE